MAGQNGVEQGGRPKMGGSIRINFSRMAEETEAGFEEGEKLSEALDERDETRLEDAASEEHSPEADELIEEYGDLDEAKYDLARLYAKTAPFMVAIHGAVGEYGWDEGDWREVLKLDDGTFDRVQARKYEECLDMPDLIRETIECAGVERVRAILEKHAERDTMAERPI